MKITKCFPLIILFLFTVYSVSHIITPPYILAGNQTNHQNFEKTLLPYKCRTASRPYNRAAGTYEEMRTGPHHVFGIVGEKYGFCLIPNKKIV